MKVFFKHKYFLLFTIFIVAVFLRFYQLGNLAPSLTWDEVSWGYNAYSLGIDAKDEFGRVLPYDYLESFGDFKPPMYAYLSILPVKIFGLTEFATRFASAFFGSLTVLLTYFLVVEIFRRSKDSLKNHTEGVAFFSAFIMAVSPWHIMLSRAAFEANVATFFLIFGVYLFLRGIHKSPWFLSISALSFVASLYTFNTSRIVAPLFVIMLVIGFWRKLLDYKKQTNIAIIVGLAFFLPLVPFLISPQAGLRFKEVNIFSDPKVVERANQEIANDNNALWSKALHNRRFLYGVEYIRHYFDNFSPSFLFIKGDGNPKFSTQDVGQMYIWELPFLIFGAFLLFRKREGYWWVIPVWLVLAIIPAATARETPHALRIETALPTFQILAAYGLFYAWVWMRSHVKKKIFQLACIAIIGGYILNIVYFVHGYYAHYAWQYSREWQYGYKESIAFVKAHEEDYDKIFVTESLGRPYVYYLFYLQIPPEQFRKEARIKRDVFGFVKIEGFGKYTFTNNMHQKTTNERILFITDRYNIPKNANVLQTFYEINGEPTLAAYAEN